MLKKSFAPMPDSFDFVRHIQQVGAQRKLHGPEEAGRLW